MKILFTAILIFTVFVGICHADSLSVANTTGNLDNGLSWRLTTKNYDPGPYETEIGLGTTLASGMKLEVVHLSSNQDTEHLGIFLTLPVKCDNGWRGFVNIQRFEALGDAKDKTKLYICFTRSVADNVSIGIASRSVKVDGNNDPSFNIGPLVQVKVWQHVSFSYRYVFKDEGRSENELALSATIN